MKVSTMFEDDRLRPSVA